MNNLIIAMKSCRINDFRSKPSHRVKLVWLLWDYAYSCCDIWQSVRQLFFNNHFEKSILAQSSRNNCTVFLHLVCPWTFLKALAHPPEQKAFFYIINYQHVISICIQNKRIFLTRILKSKKGCLSDYSWNLS